MKVFLSWSGAQSRAVAVHLRDWLPGVINSLEPFVSSEDIYAGSRWQTEIAQQLDGTHFGIVCVTRANQGSSWLNFEAGALAKAVDTSRVIPLAIDLKPSDIEIPLGQFQGQSATEAGMLQVVLSLNAALDQPLGETLLEKALKMWWPELNVSLANVNKKYKGHKQAAGPARSDREILEETLDTVRSIARGNVRTAGGTQGAPVTSDHPLVSEIERILDAAGSPAKVLCSRRGREVGVRPSGELPEQVHTEIRTRATVYGVEVVFLRPRVASGPRTMEPEPA